MIDSKSLVTGKVVWMTGIFVKHLQNRSCEKHVRE